MAVAVKQLEEKQQKQQPQKSKQETEAERIAKEYERVRKMSWEDLAKYIGEPPLPAERSAPAIRQDEEEWTWKDALLLRVREYPRILLGLPWKFTKEYCKSIWLGEFFPAVFKIEDQGEKKVRIAWGKIAAFVTVSVIEAGYLVLIKWKGAAPAVILLVLAAIDEFVAADRRDTIVEQAVKDVVAAIPDLGELVPYVTGFAVLLASAFFALGAAKALRFKGLKAMLVKGIDKAIGENEEESEAD